LWLIGLKFIILANNEFLWILWSVLWNLELIFDILRAKLRFWTLKPYFRLFDFGPQIPFLGSESLFSPKSVYFLHLKFSIDWWVTWPISFFSLPVPSTHDVLKVHFNCFYLITSLRWPIKAALNRIQCTLFPISISIFYLK
jgi:hypothetical protein